MYGVRAGIGLLTELWIPWLIVLSLSGSCELDAVSTAAISGPCYLNKRDPGAAAVGLQYCVS